jgi:YegS/Rv2252/BmrU family lipid kinase
MPAKAVLFYNPNSGRFNARQIESWLKEFAGCGLEVQGISNPEELTSLSPTHIIAAGGDGTLHMAINKAGLKHSYSILPIGSGNDFAANFRRLSIAELAQKIVSDSITPCDVLRINDVYAHNVCGTGFESFVAGKARKVRWPALKYILPIARYMFFYKPMQFKITASEFFYEGETFLVTIGNGNRSGGGFRMFPKADLHDGKMDMVIIKKHSIIQRLLYVFLVNFGKHLHLKPVVFKQVSSCKIELREEYSFQADGDLYSSNILNITVLKGGLGFVG